jgi:hypothetical protein
MKNKVLALVVLFSLLALSSNLIAKEKRGAELKIMKKDRAILKGELIAVKSTSLLLIDSQSGADQSVDIKDITTITIVKKSKALLGFLIGSSAGFLAGRAIAAGGQTDESLYLAGWVMIGSSIGGLITGALIGADQTIQIEEKSPEQIKVDLEKLQRQARITDFQ